MQQMLIYYKMQIRLLKEHLLLIEKILKAIDEIEEKDEEMDRDLDRRVELLFPVEDDATRELLDRLNRYALDDRRKGRLLQTDGSYTPSRNVHASSRSQRRTYDLFKARHQDGLPQETQPLLQPVRNWQDAAKG